MTPWRRAPLGLPDCDALFDRFFLRWHSGESRRRRVYSATRPDAEVNVELRGRAAAELTPLAADDADTVSRHIDAMVEAAASDGARFLGPSRTVDLDWIAGFDAHYDRRRIARVIESSDPEDFSSDLLVLCGEFGAALGRVLMTLVPGSSWLLDFPYWESAIFDPRSGWRLNVFHWAIKKFSDYGVDDGFRDKVLTCVKHLARERES